MLCIGPTIRQAPRHRHNEFRSPVRSAYRLLLESMIAEDVRLHRRDITQQDSAITQTYRRVSVYTRNIVYLLSSSSTRFHSALGATLGDFT
eukprot:4737120-Pyramimonas_sp.AAC.1